jgi:phosphonate transport system substrate-binding protein
MKKIILLPFIFLMNMAQAEGMLKLGVVPQQSASSLAKAWVPLTLFLSNKIGENIRFETAPNIPEFEKRVAAGMYDIVYLNPYHYTIFSKSTGLRAIAKQKGKRIKGIVVVARDSELSSLEMLNNAEIAFPAPAAFAATILPQANLTLRDIPFTPSYVSSHDSVYAGVAKGFFVAGGGIERTLSTLPKSVSNKLKVIWRSEGYTPHAFAVHPSVSDETASHIQNALVSLNSLDEGKQILNRLGFNTGIIKGVDSDWDDVRALNIKIIDL